MTTKTTLLIAILTLGLLPGLSLQADAGHPRYQSQAYISGYQRCGTPIYQLRYVAGYDRCGSPIWRVCSINRNQYLQYTYQQRPTYQYRTCRPQAGYGRTYVRHSTSSGGGYTHIYSSSSSHRYSSGGGHRYSYRSNCRTW